MQIHELDPYSGNLDSGAFLAVDNGSDTGRVSASGLLLEVNNNIQQLDNDLNGRIDNIIAGGAAPSGAEIIDARHGAQSLGGVDYASLGDSIRGQATALNDKIKTYIPLLNQANVLKNPLFVGSQGWTIASSGVIASTDTLANKVTITNSGTEQQIRQVIYLDTLDSGTYVVRYKKIGGITPRLRVFTERENGYYASYLVNVVDDHAEFNLDIAAIQAADPLMVRLSIRIILSNVGDSTISEPYLGIKGDYNDFWNKNFDYLLKEINAESNPLYGKSIYLDGDSICYGENWAGGYGKILSDEYGMVVTNAAVSGATLADSVVTHHIAQSVIDSNINTDYIIIEGGVNDRARSLPVGSVEMVYQQLYPSSYSHYDMTTFLGALEAMFLKLRTDYADKKVGFIIPHRIFQMNDVWYTTWVEGIEAACKKWGVPLLNLNDYAPLNMLTNLQTAYCPDGYHPNEAGYRKYYIPHIVSWLKTL